MSAAAHERPPPHAKRPPAAGPGAAGTLDKPARHGVVTADDIAGQCPRGDVADYDRPALGAYETGSRAPLPDRLAVLLAQARRLGYDPRRVLGAVTAPDPARALLDEARRAAVARQLENLAASVRDGRAWFAIVAEIDGIGAGLLDSAESGDGAPGVAA